MSRARGAHPSPTRTQLAARALTFARFARRLAHKSHISVYSARKMRHFSLALLFCASRGAPPLPACTFAAPGETYDLSPIRGTLPANSEDGFSYSLGICGDVDPARALLPGNCEPGAGSVAYQFKQDSCHPIGGPAALGTVALAEVRRAFNSPQAAPNDLACLLWLLFLFFFFCFPHRLHTRLLALTKRLPLRRTRLAWCSAFPMAQTAARRGRARCASRLLVVQRAVPCPSPQRWPLAPTWHACRAARAAPRSAARPRA